MATKRKTNRVKPLVARAGVKRGKARYDKGGKLKKKKS